MNTVQPIRDVEKIEEIKRRLRKRSYRDYILFLTGINSGLRVSDLLSLRVCDVRGRSHIVLREQKTDKVKRFRINAALGEEIAQYIDGMDEDSWLFPSRQSDKPLGRVQAYNVLHKVAKEVGLEEIGTHTLRKTFGWHFYQKTKDVALLQELFNHAAPSVTLRYICYNQDVLDRAIDDFSL